MSWFCHINNRITLANQWANATEKTFLLLFDKNLQMRAEKAFRAALACVEKGYAACPLNGIKRAGRHDKATPRADRKAFSVAI